MQPESSLGTLILIFLVATSGCDPTATQVAREAADRQAQQNSAMAKLNQEVASGTHELVAADAKARQEIVGVHRDLQAERVQLNNGWNKLSDERTELAGQRQIGVRSSGIPDMHSPKQLQFEVRYPDGTQ